MNIFLQEKKADAESRFAEISSGWLNLKKSTETPYSGSIFVKNGELNEKIISIESVGQIGIKELGQVKSFKFHHLAPVAVTSQADSVILYKVYMTHIMGKAFLQGLIG